MGDSAIKGSCLCGAVRYRIVGQILNFQYCHCSRCRKLTGSAHAANLFTRPDDLEWVEGETFLGGYLLPGDPPFATAFCKRCGSSMPSMSRSGKFWVIPAGSLDEDPGVTPQRNIFWGSRATWFHDTGGLPRHDELP